ncbi:hypothetical protein V5799_033466 [Amblyomma americanum]|uniref:Uncharacterized protein n=1 Tax=Amblyomma americanum TaxID=6943 RepID=A0AAQ4DN83_AMBAM
MGKIILTIVVDIEEFIRQAGSWYAFSFGSEGYLEILDNTTFVNDPHSRKEIHLGFFRRREREALEKLLEEEDDDEWDDFSVTRADVEAEKEFFRRSMMTDGVALSALQDLEGSAKDAACLG